MSDSIKKWHELALEEYDLGVQKGKESKDECTCKDDQKSRPYCPIHDADRYNILKENTSRIESEIRMDEDYKPVKYNPGNLFNVHDQMEAFVKQLKAANIVIPDFIKFTAELSPKQFYNLQQDCFEKGISEIYANKEVVSGQIPITLKIKY